jgi:hypothetical protein
MPHLSLAGCIFCTVITITSYLQRQLTETTTRGNYKRKPPEENNRGNFTRRKYQKNYRRQPVNYQKKLPEETIRGGHTQGNNRGICQWQLPPNILFFI